MREREIKQICLTLSFITNLGGGREKKVYESLDLFSIVNQTVVSETFEHIYMLISA